MRVLCCQQPPGLHALSGTILVSLLASAFGPQVIWAGTVPAEQEEITTFNIPASDLPTALIAFSIQAHTQIVSASNEVNDLRTAGVTGRFTVEQALRVLLAGSGLDYRITSSGVITIGRFLTPRKADKAGQQVRGKSELHWFGDQAVNQPESVISTELQEVIVTAEKRPQNLQAVPDTIETVPGDILLERNVPDINEIQQVAPDVDVATGTGVSVNLAIRGIHSGSFGPTTDSPNTLYLDGAPLTTFTGLNGLYFDLQEVDVLDGPQGTLYGRNSVGGLINFTTNKPGSTFGGYGTFEVGNFNDFTAQAAVNLPVSPSLAARVAFFHYRHAGYMTDTGQVDADETSGRLELQWRPSGHDTLLLTADNARVGGEGGSGTTITRVFKNPVVYTNSQTGAVSLGCPAGATCTSAEVPITVTSSPWRNGVLYGNGDFSHQDTDNDGFLLRYEHQSAFTTLTAQASRRSSNTFDLPLAAGITGLQQSAALVAAGIFLGAAQPPTLQAMKSQWDTEELRLASVASTPFSWVAGLFRYHELGTNNNSIPLATSATSTGGLVFPAPTAPVGPDTTVSSAYASDTAAPLNNDNARAVFGQVTWTPGFASALHLTGGARYNWESKHGIGFHYISDVGLFNSYDLTDHWNATTWKANAAYDLTRNNMVYLDRSNGFQSGGFAFGPSPEYQPETIQAWELGSKNRFSQNRLQVNASAWYYQVNQLTTAVTDIFTQPTAQGPVAIPTIAITNAGDARIIGQSLDVQWLITAADRLAVNVQHLDTQFIAYNLTQRYLDNNYFNYCVGNPNGAPPCSNPVNYFPGYSQTGNQTQPSFNYSHTPVGFSPDYSANTAFDHTFRAHKATWDVQLIFHFVGRQLSGNQVAPFAYPYASYYMLPSHATWDLNITCQLQPGQWKVIAFVRNLFDEAYETAAGYSVSTGRTGVPYSSPSVTYAYGTAAFGPPRTYGLLLQHKF